MKQYAKFVSGGSMSLTDPPSFTGDFYGPAQRWHHELDLILKQGWVVINTAMSMQPPDRYGIGSQTIVFLLEREKERDMTKLMCRVTNCENTCKPNSTACAKHSED